MACSALGCAEPSTLSWRRHATRDEIIGYQQSGDLGAGDPDTIECLLDVYGCDQHKISMELASRTHDAPCTAPPDCDCSVSEV